MSVRDVLLHSQTSYLHWDKLMRMAGRGLGFFLAFGLRRRARRVSAGWQTCGRAMQC